MQFETALFESSTTPAYMRIAAEAERLRALNLSFEAIGDHLGVTGKTVAKALRFRFRN